MSGTPAPTPTNDPAPEPTGDDTGGDELEPLPEGQQQFDREYVEKLRHENGRYRQRARDIESHFEGYSPEERSRYLELAGQLHSNPEAALEEFEGVTARLRKQLGKETPVEPEPTTPTDPAPTQDGPATQADIDRIVSERLEAERAKADEDARIQSTIAEADELGFTSPEQKAQLFAKAQSMNDGRGAPLSEAAAALSGDFDSAVEAAVEARLAELASGRSHPPRLPSGDPANAQDQGPPKTLDEAKARAAARLDASYR